MPNIIPPLLSSTPPPIVDDDEEDEFGDFRASVDLSFGGCDGLSLPSTPEHLQRNRLPEESLDLNSNSDEQRKVEEKGLEKDFQDRRKNAINLNSACNRVISENLDMDGTKCQFMNGFEKNDTVLDETAENKSAVESKSDLELKLPESVDNSSCLNSQIDTDKDTVNTNADNTTSVVDSEITEFPSSHFQVAETVKVIEDAESSIVKSIFAEKIPENVLIDDHDFSDFRSFENEKPALNQDENDLTSDNRLDLDDRINSEDFGSNCREDLMLRPDRINGKISDTDERLSLGDESTDDFSDFQVPAADATKAITSKSDEDDFGDFEKFPIKAESPSSLNPATSEMLEQEDDFGDFENACDSISATHPEKEENDWGEFADFAFDSQKAVPSNEIGFADFQVAEQSKCNDDDFGDFEECPVKTGSALQIPSENEEDEFGGFGSFSAAEVSGDFGASGSEKAEQIIKSAFPTVDIKTDDFVDSESTEKTPVFDLLKDIMETNALKFHWVNSSSQKLLLKALNIDMRNILYGPGWNLTVPKFAANLGLSPLEPLKPEILTPEVVTPKPPQQPTDVPSAQFDWTSAGLTNPLDYSQTMLLDIEQLVATLDISSCNPTSQNSSPLWDVWLETAQNEEQPSAPDIGLDWSFLGTARPEQGDGSRKESPAHSLNFEVNHDSLSLQSEGDADSQFDAAEELRREAALPNMVPLRETHICGEKPPSEDDFDDFQMSLPVKSAQPLPLEPLKPLVVHAPAAKIEWPAPGLTEDDIQTIELTYSKQPEAKLPKAVEEVGWTDFMSHREGARTSPEKVQNNLQLSVFNLGNIQPIKPPVPVITPHGLLQTKLTSGSISPLTGSPQRAQRQLTARPPDGYQPAIISQQYSKQFSEGAADRNCFALSLNNYGLHPGFGRPEDSGSLFAPSARRSACDDDDWTDFVSSAPAPSLAANVVANPSRYDPLREFGLNGDVLNGGGVRKSSVPGVNALPDLDFVVGKSRTFAKK